MEKRLPLALLLSLLFVWVYLGVFAPKPPPEGADGAAPAVAAAEGTPAPGVAPAAQPAGGSAATGPAAPEDPRESSVGLPPLEGEGYVAQFETRGGGLAWLDLTGFHVSLEQDSHLRLIGAGRDAGLSLLLRDFSDQWGLDRTNWEVEDGANELGRRRITFRKRLENGLLLVRTIDDRGRPCSFDLSLEVVNEGGLDVGGTLSLVLQGAHGLLDENGSGSFMSTPPTALVAVRGADGEAQVAKWSGDDLTEGTPRQVGPGERLLAAGTISNYFAALLAPAEGSFVAQVAPAAVLDAARLEREVEARAPADEASRAVLRAQLAGGLRTAAAANLLLASTPPAPGRTVRWEFTVFAGPQGDSLARAEGLGFLEPVLEDRYGSMAWINHALLAVLRAFHAAFGNWGVAIILLTLLVRVLLFPLNRVQQSSMQRYSAMMQRLKPQLDELKAKHKNNMRKYNEEQMKLLKEHGVRPPLGGCLLMFLQFPIWIALFQILRSSIELRHAPFAFWVHDLSRPDQMPFPWLGTLNLLPILMAAAQILQMRMQPKPADESQAQMQKMMAWMMPAMMLFFLYSYPSGLALYIFTSSLFGILEYRLVKKLWPPPEVPVAAPARG
jgi:YidC/Oxa1 family membrane protein insertase